MIHHTAILEGNIQFTHGEDSVTIAPYAVLRGNVVIGNQCTIEPHACVEGTVKIGDHCYIGHHSLIGGLPQDLSFDPQTQSGVVLGDNNTIRELVTIHRSTQTGGNTILGDHNFLMGASHVAHDVTIGDHNVFANAVLLAGHIHVGSHTFLGGGAAFHQFINIGDRAMAQGHASISQDVPPFTIVHGLNKVAGLNVIGMRRGGIDAAERSELKSVFQSIVREGANKDSIQAAHDTTQSEFVKTFLTAFLSPGRKGICRRM